MRHGKWRPGVDGSTLGRCAIKRDLLRIGGKRKPRATEEIRPALHRAQKEVDRGSVALVNVKTDGRARATTVAFSQYMT